MHRPVLATAVLLSAALATAGCGGSSSSDAAAGSSPSSATHSYSSMLDLGSALAGGSPRCSGLAIQPTSVAKAQATCDLPSGKQLVLQLWRTSAQRDQGVQAIASNRAAQHLGSCVVEGTGEKALWSVDASADPSVCAGIATRLGGRVHKTAGATS